jgi:hypothetical protein
LERLAVDIHDHYTAACDEDPRRIQKAMVVCSSRLIAYALLLKFKDKYPEWFEEKNILPSIARKFSVRLWNKLRTLKKTVGTLWTAGIQRLPYAKAYSDTARALLRLEWWLKNQ